MFINLQIEKIAHDREMSWKNWNSLQESFFKLKWVLFEEKGCCRCIPDCCGWDLLGSAITFFSKSQIKGLTTTGVTKTTIFEKCSIFL